jgi:hypothetical protein
MAQQQHPMCVANNSLQQQQQQLSCPALSIPKPELGSPAGGSFTSPGNSCSSSGTLLSSPHCSSEVTTVACGQQQDLGMIAAAAQFGGSREWLYRLVTFPSYFTPCVSCCGGSRAPKREQLMTLFDTACPYQVYCSHCPEVKSRTDGSLLQVRRSAFKDVVKATDIARFGCDVAGVQQYTLNGSKVIYLNREQAPERKGSGASSAPAQCSVDGRAMMDKSSQYCSLKCKMHAEDPGFNSWLDTQDPSVRILAQAAANAPPRPTVACKRANPCSSACSSEDASAATDASGSAASSGSRPAKKPARTASGSVSSFDAAAAAAVPAAVTMDMPCYGIPRMSMGMGSRVMVAPPGVAPLPAAGSYMQPHQPQMMPGMRRAASACLPGSSSAAAAAAPVGLRRVRISLAGQQRQQSAPSALSLEAALTEPLLQPAAAPGVPAGMVCGKDCLLPCCNEDMFSLSGSWDSALDSALSSPSQLAGLEDFEDLEAWASSGAEDDGCMSPALINAPRSAFGSASSSAGEWWLSAAGPFADAGMGALVMGSAEGGDGGVLGAAEDDDGALLLPGSSSGYECCDMVMSMMAAESLSGAALMLH